ncbi:hypothetical protein RIF29_19752 [Crotalaria pallida]|uniref:Uncharacterized protein n=1 Tax=Crotalaria pallida TaxID=3830 RepID=A0AAN9F469_CROPI
MLKSRASLVEDDNVEDGLAMVSTKETKKEPQTKWEGSDHDGDGRDIVSGGAELCSGLHRFSGACSYLLLFGLEVSRFLIVICVPVTANDREMVMMKNNFYNGSHMSFRCVSSITMCGGSE